jgi:hypothetical protein
MKSLILLFLVIGAVVSQITLTTGSATAAPQWTLTYATPTGENFYGYTLALQAKDASSLTLLTGGATTFTGVVCKETTSTFDVITAAGPGWSWTFGNGGNAADSTTAANTGFLIMTLTYHPLMTITAATAATAGTTGLGSIACQIVTAPTPLPTAGAANTLSWVSTGINSCGNLKASGVAFYAKCFNFVQQAATLQNTAASVAITAINTGTNVTVAASATSTCATTTGASTLATGATILAGIAYLQF